MKNSDLLLSIHLIPVSVTIAMVIILSNIFRSIQQREGVDWREFKKFVALAFGSLMVWMIGKDVASSSTIADEVVIEVCVVIIIVCLSAVFAYRRLKPIDSRLKLVIESLERESITLQQAGVIPTCYTDDLRWSDLGLQLTLLFKIIFSFKNQWAFIP